MSYHRLDTGVWKDDATPQQGIDRVQLMEDIYTAIGRRFQISWANGKFLYMVGDFTAAEKATIKGMLETAGVV